MQFIRKKIVSKTADSFHMTRLTDLDHSKNCDCKLSQIFKNMRKLVNAASFFLNHTTNLFIFYFFSHEAPLFISVYKVRYDKLSELRVHGSAVIKRKSQQCVCQ